jgi:hypothetical protein
VRFDILAHFRTQLRKELGDNIIGGQPVGILRREVLIGDREALLSFFSDPEKFIAATPFAFLMVALIVLIFGAGRISADTAITFFFGSARV